MTVLTLGVIVLDEAILPENNSDSVGQNFSFQPAIYLPPRPAIGNEYVLTRESISSYFIAYTSNIPPEWGEYSV